MVRERRGCAMDAFNVPTTVFDEVRTKILGDAYDAVCGKLHGTRYPDSLRETIAGRVLAIAAASPDHNPETLAKAVVTSLGIKF
jgi:hypothetical protein